MRHSHIPPYTLDLVEHARINIAMKNSNWRLAPHQQEYYEWLRDSDWRTDMPIRVNIAPRGSGKSTSTSCYIANSLANYPNQSFLIVSANRTVAEDIYTETKRQLEEHPFCAHIAWALNKTKTKWTNRDLRLPGSRLNEPNISIKTVGSTATGGHFDCVIFDDIEIWENSNSESKLLQLYAAHRNFRTMANGGRSIYDGTFYNANPIYVYIVEHFVKNKNAYRIKPYVDGMYPEVYTPDFIEGEKQDEWWWNTQYLLNPQDKSFGGLDPSFIRVLDCDIEKQLPFSRYAGGSLRINDNELMEDISVFWDWASATPGNDRSVVTIAGVTNLKNYVIIDSVQLPPVDKNASSNLNYWHPQHRKIIEAMKKYRLEDIHVESDGSDPGGVCRALNDYAAMNSEPCNVIPYKQPPSVNGKVGRIQRTLEPLLMGGKIYAAKHIDLKFLTEEINSFPDTKSKRDTIDSMVSAFNILANPLEDSNLNRYAEYFIEPVSRVC